MECKDCEYKGYSPELCRLHARHCKARQGVQQKPLSPAVRIGAKTLAGAGVGMAAVMLGSAAISLVGGAAVLHAVLLKVGAGAGLTGGGIGLFKGLVDRRHDKTTAPSRSIA